MARNNGIYLKYKGSANASIERFTKDIEKELLGYKGNLKDKLERVLDVVEQVSQQYVPEDTGATSQSFYREVVEEDGKIIARAGYDREGQLPYIVYIHEFLPANGFQKAGADIRFLSKGFQAALQQINQILSEDK